MHIAVVLLAGFLCGCAIPRGRSERGSCEFVVYNRTTYALDVRAMRDTTGRSTPAPIGALNPGESLTEQVPCGQGSVWVRGFTIPLAVGWPTKFAFVDGWVDLAPGQKPSVSLHWP